MNELKVFKNEKFGSVRTLVKDGEIWFVGKDVAVILGYTNPQKAIRDHVDEEDKTVNDSFTVNGTKGLLINESGLYSLVLSSKMPEAKPFKRWVTSEVIPSIRKYGMYARDELLDNPDLLLDVVKKLKEERDARLLAESKLKDANSKIEEQQATLDSQDIAIEMLTKKAVEIKDRSFLNLLVRKIAHIRCMDYAKCWTKLYKLIQYKLSINLKLRQQFKGTKTAIENISDSEWNDIVYVSVGWFFELGGTADDISDMLGVDADRLMEV